MLGSGPPADVEGRSIETMEILLRAGANVNARVTDTTILTARIARSSTMTNREGQTVLFFAAQSGRAAVVRFLLDHGASARNNAEVTNMLRTALSKGIAPVTR